MHVTETESSAPTQRDHPPVPSTVSAHAQAMLSMPKQGGDNPYPAPEDTEGWLAQAQAVDAMLRTFVEPGLPPAETYTVEAEKIDGVSNFVIRPADLTAPDAPIFIDIHGGALYLGGGDIAWMGAAAHAVGRNGITWAPDYRMPPLHPFPAALDDLLVLYRAALELAGPHRVVVSGGSAGGNLAAALLVRAKDEGLPMPAALVLLTPEVDLTEAGDTFTTNNGIDNMLGPLMTVNLLYAAGEDLTHPYVSPLFADLEGFPPTFLQSGTRDLFLSNTVRMHRKLRKAGVPTELHVFEAMPHGGFGGSPEDEELRAETRRFEAEHLERAQRADSHPDSRGADDADA
ncbi:MULTISPECIES: alpha/beta hydrolase [unclassified Microbacterium]|uniref:alpha/beta hydrolase n=1 Tax=unclassified Microbacterium TaxID=2609290 RepID=UPI000EAA65A0|nr:MULTISPECIES: alpha/beta hydrolase [unclassified Microbacterium]MBT2486511.1 alpha/beta hydrolase [Microbacterium sp. ISL-108]RKN69207.1 alpha/beta hydrolase [Microbacterium sp. CGR2]